MLNIHCHKKGYKFVILYLLNTKKVTGHSNFAASCECLSNMKNSLNIVEICLWPQAGQTTCKYASSCRSGYTEAGCLNNTAACMCLNNTIFNYLHWQWRQSNGKTATPTPFKKPLDLKSKHPKWLDEIRATPLAVKLNRICAWWFEDLHTIVSTLEGKEETKYTARNDFWQ